MCWHRMVESEQHGNWLRPHQCSPGMEQQVYNDVKTLPHVTDATVLFGDHDLIVKLEATTWPPSPKPWLNTFVPLKVS